MKITTHTLAIGLVILGLTVGMSGCGQAAKSTTSTNNSNNTPSTDSELSIHYSALKNIDGKPLLIQSVEKLSLFKKLSVNDPSTAPSSIDIFERNYRLNDEQSNERGTTRYITFRNKKYELSKYYVKDNEESHFFMTPYSDFTHLPNDIVIYEGIEKIETNIGTSTLLVTSTEPDMNQLNENLRGKNFTKHTTTSGIIVFKNTDLKTIINEASTERTYNGSVAKWIIVFMARHFSKIFFDYNPAI